MDLEHGLVVDVVDAGAVITGVDNVRVDHIVPHNTERFGIVVHLPFPSEIGICHAVVKPRRFVWSLEFVIGVCQTMSVWGQSQAQLVGWYWKLDRVLHLGQLQQSFSGRGRGKCLFC